ncbi:putative tRNA methyltransferase 1 L homeolog [Paratrimastix pyriformis]|uniref:tRNA (guanine(26)-N(2))-dimethyltransferase n=1 Tax=Paratrimastix pyriformis TaxID=342808 RepID=A0ABQ8UWD1_9EUKA|nr:putative tRNA methyltransferase 1 L homeolog [Paratrimastix pyriformis]
MATEKTDGEKSFKIVTEGKASVLFEGSDVFYNPVQHFNRDLTSTQPARQRKAKPKANPESEPSVTAPPATEPAAPSPATAASVAATPTPVAQAAPGITILEALAASGLRSIRYFLEVPGVSGCVANDLDPDAVKSIHRNLEYNHIDPTKVVAHQGDAILYMHECNATRKRFDMIDLDPYGTAAPFLDAAVQAVAEGGLLCITCTDMGVLAGNTPEVCWTKYGTVPVKARFCHEMALRILLGCISTHAGRHSRYIVPLLSLSADFYVRVFVRVYTSPAACKRVVSLMAHAYKCNQCPSFYTQPLARTVGPDPALPHKCVPTAGFPFESIHCPNCLRGRFLVRTPHPSPPLLSPVGFPNPQSPISPRSPLANTHSCTAHPSYPQTCGPLWGGPLHDRTVLQQSLDYLDAHPQQFHTHRRICGTLAAMLQELPDVMFYYDLHELNGAMRLGAPGDAIRSAIVQCGYRLSVSHIGPLCLKTDAPPEVIWDVFRHWAWAHPPKPLVQLRSLYQAGRLGDPARAQQTAPEGAEAAEGDEGATICPEPTAEGAAQPQPQEATATATAAQPQQPEPEKRKKSRLEKKREARGEGVPAGDGQQQQPDAESPEAEGVLSSAIRLLATMPSGTGPDFTMPLEVALQRTFPQVPAAAIRALPNLLTPHGGSGPTAPIVLPDFPAEPAAAAPTEASAPEGAEAGEEEAGKSDHAQMTVAEHRTHRKDTKDAKGNFKPRFFPNPEPEWGPKPRAHRGNVVEMKRQKFEKEQQERIQRKRAAHLEIVAQQAQQGAPKPEGPAGSPASPPASPPPAEQTKRGRVDPTWATQCRPCRNCDCAGAGVVEEVPKAGSVSHPRVPPELRKPKQSEKQIPRLLPLTEVSAGMVPAAQAETSTVPTLSKRDATARLRKSRRELDLVDQSLGQLRDILTTNDESGSFRSRPGQLSWESAPPAFEKVPLESGFGPGQTSTTNSSSNSSVLKAAASLPLPADAPDPLIRRHSSTGVSQHAPLEGAPPPPQADSPGSGSDLLSLLFTVRRRGWHDRSPHPDDSQGTLPLPRSRPPDWAMAGGNDGSKTFPRHRVEPSTPQPPHPTGGVATMRRFWSNRSLTLEPEAAAEGTAPAGGHLGGSPLFKSTLPGDEDSDRRSPTPSPTGSAAVGPGAAAPFSPTPARHSILPPSPSPPPPSISISTREPAAAASPRSTPSPCASSTPPALSPRPAPLQTGAPVPAPSAPSAATLGLLPASSPPLIDLSPPFHPSPSPPGSTGSSGTPPMPAAAARPFSFRPAGSPSASRTSSPSVGAEPAGPAQGGPAASPPAASSPGTPPSLSPHTRRRAASLDQAALGTRSSPPSAVPLTPRAAALTPSVLPLPLLEEAAQPQPAGTPPPPVELQPYVPGAAASPSEAAPAPAAATHLFPGAMPPNPPALDLVASLGAGIGVSPRVTRRHPGMAEGPAGSPPPAAHRGQSGLSIAVADFLGGAAAPPVDSPRWPTTLSEISMQRSESANDLVVEPVGAAGAPMGSPPAPPRGPEADPSSPLVAASPLMGGPGPAGSPPAITGRLLDASPSPRMGLSWRSPHRVPMNPPLTPVSEAGSLSPTNSARYSTPLSVRSRLATTALAPFGIAEGGSGDKGEAATEPPEPPPPRHLSPTLSRGSLSELHSPPPILLNSFSSGVCMGGSTGTGSGPMAAKESPPLSPSFRRSPDGLPHSLSAAAEARDGAGAVEGGGLLTAIGALAPAGAGAGADLTLEIDAVPMQQQQPPCGGGHDQQSAPPAVAPVAPTVPRSPSSAETPSPRSGAESLESLFGRAGRGLIPLSQVTSATSLITATGPVTPTRGLPASPASAVGRGKGWSGSEESTASLASSEPRPPGAPSTTAILPPTPPARLLPSPAVAALVPLNPNAFTTPAAAAAAPLRGSGAKDQPAPAFLPSSLSPARRPPSVHHPRSCSSSTGVTCTSFLSLPDNILSMGSGSRRPAGNRWSLPNLHPAGATPCQAMAANSSAGGTPPSACSAPLMAYLARSPSALAATPTTPTPTTTPTLTHPGAATVVAQPPLSPLSGPSPISAVPCASQQRGGISPADPVRTPPTAAAEVPLAAGAPAISPGAPAQAAQVSAITPTMLRDLTLPPADRTRLVGFSPRSSPSTTTTSDRATRRHRHHHHHRHRTHWVDAKQFRPMGRSSNLELPPPTKDGLAVPAALRAALESSHITAPSPILGSSTPLLGPADRKSPPPVGLSRGAALLEVPTTPPISGRWHAHAHSHGHSGPNDPNCPGGPDESEDGPQPGAPGGRPLEDSDSKGKGATEIEAETARLIDELAVRTQGFHRLVQLFSCFLPQEFYPKDGLNGIKLGLGEERVLSIFFSDIRDFTAMTENLPVGDVLELLNGYYAHALPPIHECEGFVDKFIGDSVMAIFPGAESAYNSLGATIGLMRAMDAYNAEQRVSRGLMPIETGVGINTGPVIVGTCGTDWRMSTTVLGDTVNLASRTEHLCK